MKYKIASRGSKLALYQANHVRDLLQQKFPQHEWEIQIFTTTGDRFLDRPLSAFGGKGAFLKEIEEALMAGTAEVAVHSLKDVPAVIGEGLALTAFLPREDPRDVWVSRQESLFHLPAGKLVGTSSLRRNILLGVYRSDLRVDLLRGNLDTRLRKVNEGQYDGIVVAAAGLHRLKLFDDSYMHYLSEDAFIPAIGQGVIVIETRTASPEVSAMVAQLNDPPTSAAAAIERKFLSFYEGGCQLPVGGLATQKKDEWHFRAFIGGVKSRHMIQDAVESPDPESCALLMFERLQQQGATELLAELKQ